MRPGNRQPSRAAAAMDPDKPESRFRDPSAENVNFSRWPSIPSTRTEEEEPEDNSIEVLAERSILAGNKELESDGQDEKEDEDDEMDPEREDSMEEDQDRNGDGDTVMGEDDDHDGSTSRRPMSYESKGAINKFGKMRMLEAVFLILRSRTECIDPTK